MSRTDNTLPHRVLTPGERRKHWKTRGMANEKQARASAYWRSVRAQERKALAGHGGLTPARHRHRAIWGC